MIQKNMAFDLDESTSLRKGRDSKKGKDQCKKFLPVKLASLSTTEVNTTLIIMKSGLISGTT